MYFKKRQYSVFYGIQKIKRVKTYQAQKENYHLQSFQAAKISQNKKWLYGKTQTQSIPSNTYQEGKVQFNGACGTPFTDT